MLHHFIKKSQSTGLRYHWENCINLCNKCHCSIHQGKNDLITGKIVAIKGLQWLEDLEIEKRARLGIKYSREWYENQYILLSSKEKI